MANIVFFDEGHSYTVDGEPVPSVSEVTRFMAREIYDQTRQQDMDKAADRGTKIHKATEVLDKYRAAEVDDEYIEYLKAYMAFCKEYKPSWEKIECPVNNEKLYAGTIDRYGMIGEQKVLLDIKSTATISPAHRALYTAAQNLYRMALEKLGLRVDAIWILQLKKDGTYKIYQLEVQDELANACIALHQALKKRTRARKENTDD